MIFRRKKKGLKPPVALPGHPKEAADVVICGGRRRTGAPQLVQESTSAQFWIFPEPVSKPPLLVSETTRAVPVPALLTGISNRMMEKPFCCHPPSPDKDR